MVSNIEKHNAALSAEERTAAAKRAGAASGEARRAHKAFRLILREMLALDLEDADEAVAALKKLGLKPNQENALMLAALAKAKSGDIEALRFVRDTLGEKPTENYNLGMADKPIRSIDLSELSDEELAALADRVD